MNNYDSILKMLKELIQEEIKYCVPRIGQILDINDPKKKGRVLVAIPDFNWTTRDTAAWCFAKDKKAIITPGIKEYVLVEWIGGDRNKPIYSGNAMEMLNMLPKNYDKNSNSQVLYESNSGNEYVKYNLSTKILELVGMLTINLLAASESFVKGDTHKTALDNLCTTIAAITPAGSSAANIASIQAAFATFSGTLSSMLSIKIKGE